MPKHQEFSLLSCTGRIQKIYIDLLFVTAFVLLDWFESNQTKVALIGFLPSKMARLVRFCGQANWDTFNIGAEEKSKHSHLIFFNNTASHKSENILAEVSERERGAHHTLKHGKHTSKIISKHSSLAGKSQAPQLHLLAQQRMESWLSVSLA